MMRRYRFDLGGVRGGPDDAVMRIAPEWHGDPPPTQSYDIVGAPGAAMSRRSI